MDSVNVLLTQGGSILIIPFVLQLLKDSKLPALAWISEDTKGLNRAIAWVAGLLTAAGIHMSAEVHGAVYAFTIDFSAFTVGAVLHALGAGGAQIAGQEYTYRAIQAGQQLRRIVELLERVAGPSAAPRV